MEKYCKINTTAFNPKKTIKEWGGVDSWPFHGQDLHSPKLYRQMIDTLFDVERDTDPGVDMDSYMVVYKDEGNEWVNWEQYDNQPIKRGTFHVIFEERDGGNYQMFNKAYQLLRNDYDWFIFTCDDIMVFGDQYYKRFLERWAEEENIGYLALQGGGDNPTETEQQSHVQGSIGMTSKKILEEVCAINGGELPHPKTEPWTQDANIHEGEIPFTHKILELGYRFYNYDGEKKWSKNNFCYPYYLYANE